MALCALTYPLVWGGAVLAGAAVALLVVDRTTDTRGLGEYLLTFAVAVGVLSVLWAVMAFTVLRHHGHPALSAIASLGTPVAVIAGAYQNTSYGVALAAVLPAAAAWWATAP